MPPETLPQAPLAAVVARNPPIALGRGVVADQRDDRVSLALQILAMLPGALAVAMFAVVEADGPFGWTHTLTLLGQLALMGVGGIAMRRLSRQWITPPSVSPVLVLLGILPLAWEPVSRQFFGSGLPYELLTMSILRNVILGLAVLSPWRRFHALSLAMSLFLVLFGIVGGSDPALKVLAGLFAATAIAWLVSSHWNDVQQRLDTRQARRRPRWGLVAAIGFAVVGLLWLSGGDRVLGSTLHGFLASSGGSGRQDSFSRSGVGDGEMLVAGSERIQSFAPIENAPFVSDHEPSLYDVFDDTYEEEVKRPRDQDRAIGLPPEMAAKLKEHLHSRVEKANREFSTQRRPADGENTRSARSVASDAVFHVAGRVPLHLRLQPYDLFDGVTWYPQDEPTVRIPLQITSATGKPWLSLPDRSAVRPYLCPVDSHAIKVVRLDTNIIPAPLHTHGVHIDQVDRLDMYAWGPDGLVRLDRKKLPPLIPIHLTSRTVDVDRIGSDLSVYSAVEPVFRQIPATADPDGIRELARSWTKDIPRGWRQVEAIRRQLRTQYKLDPAARPVADAASPVRDFLFHSRKGPDYQFATAAALLLRSLGYSTRVVSGFYVDPARYDRTARHTPVQASDVHFWTEVNVAGGDWLTVEASPGYEVLLPPPSLWQRLSSAASVAAADLLEHGFVVFGVLMLAVGSYVQRRRIADGLDTLRWRLTRHRGGGTHVLATLRLIERRSARAGRPRPTGITASRWLTGELGREMPGVAPELEALRRWIDEAVYSREGVRAEAGAVRQVGDRVTRALSQTWFRRQPNPAAENRHMAS